MLKKIINIGNRNSYTVCAPPPLKLQAPRQKSFCIKTNRKKKKKMLLSVCLSENKQYPTVEQLKLV